MRSASPESPMSRTPPSPWTLGYDNLDRLNSGSRIGTMNGCTYDVNGNRLSESGINASTYTVSGASNRLERHLGRALEELHLRRRRQRSAPAPRCTRTIMPIALPGAGVKSYFSSAECPDASAIGYAAIILNSYLRHGEIGPDMSFGSWHRLCISLLRLRRMDTLRCFTPSRIR
jgi:hypothetical protein